MLRDFGRSEAGNSKPEKTNTVNFTPDKLKRLFRNQAELFRKRVLGGIKGNKRGKKKSHRVLSFTGHTQQLHGQQSRAKIPREQKEIFLTLSCAV